jgi:4-hydroxybenzoate polyprenyltransferase
MKTSAITLGRWDVIGVMLFYSVYLVSWSVLGSLLGLGWVYQLGIGAAAAQAAWHYTLIRRRTRDGCFQAFRQNHWLGFAVFAGVALDLALR